MVRELAGIPILLVDDEPDVREVLAGMLQARGADVVAVATNQEALDAFKRHIPQLLITAIRHKGETGFDLVRAVRALPPEEGGSVPAIALTANIKPDSIQTCEFNTWLEKPVRINALVAAVQEALAQPPK